MVKRHWIVTWKFNGKRDVCLLGPRKGREWRQAWAVIGTVAGPKGKPAKERRRACLDWFETKGQAERNADKRRAGLYWNRIVVKQGRRYETKSDRAERQELALAKKRREQEARKAAKKKEEVKRQKAAAARKRRAMKKKEARPAVRLARVGVTNG